MEKGSNSDDTSVKICMDSAILSILRIVFSTSLLVLLSISSPSLSARSTTSGSLPASLSFPGPLGLVSSIFKPHPIPSSMSQQSR